MPARKRRTTYPPPRNARPPDPAAGPPEPQYLRPTVASINLSAGVGRSGLKVGDRVRITGGGLYAGEPATIDKLTNGVIPSAVVRTDAGRTRQVRTIDLEPVSGSQPPAAPPRENGVPEPGAAEA